MPRPYPETIAVQCWGKTGEFIIVAGEWQTNAIPFRFEDRLFSNSGTLLFHADTGAVDFSCDQPYTNELADPAKLHQYFGSVIRHIAHQFTFGWSPPSDTIPDYDAEAYHLDLEYTGSPDEALVKRVQAGILQSLLPDQKILIAGCSAGELVYSCRATAMDAWGFDPLTNIQQLCRPALRPFVRTGYLQHIPFGPDDHFDALAAIDVFEHIPERNVPQVVQECLRLQVSRLVLLINLAHFSFPGHITLRPLHWWEQQFAPHFRRVHTQAHFPQFPAVYSNNGDYNRQWTVWEKTSTHQEGASS